MKLFSSCFWNHRKCFLLFLFLGGFFFVLFCFAFTFLHFPYQIVKVSVRALLYDQLVF